MLWLDSDLETWLDNSLAVEADRLSDTILNVSGFGKPEVFFEMLEKKRELATNMNALIQRHICMAFPAYTPTDIEAMTLEEQVELLAKAEEALNSRIDFERLFGRANKQPMKRSSFPVPEGMETTEIPDITAAMHASAADAPNFEKINDNRREVH